MIDYAVSRPHRPGLQTHIQIQLITPIQKFQKKEKQKKEKEKLNTKNTKQQMSRHVKGKQYTIAETPVIWPPCFPTSPSLPPFHISPPINTLPSNCSLIAPICFFLSLHLLFLSLSFLFHGGQKAVPRRV